MNRSVPSPANNALDYAVLGIRLLYLVVLGVGLVMLLSEPVSPSRPLNGVIAPFGLILGANLLILLLVSVKSLESYTVWGMVVADVLTVSMLAGWVGNSPLLTLLLLVTVLSVSLLRLPPLLGLLDGVLSLVAFVGGLALAQPNTPLAVELRLLALPLLAGALIGVGAGVLRFFVDQHFTIQHSKAITLAKDREVLLKAMRERTHAVNNMVQTLSSNLNYQRVLDAALAVGRLALYDESTSSFIGAVLLYRPEDRRLYIVNGVGMSRQDETRTVPGKTGIIGESLKLCEPVFSENVRGDEEVSSFFSFQRSRSVVVIPLRAGYDNYGVMIFASSVPNAFNEDYRDFLASIGIQTTLALQNAALYQNLMDDKERIVEVEEEARKKLARDLHDGPTQTIASIAMRMGAIRRMLEKSPERVPDELVRIEDMAKQTATEIRTMMFTLRPLALESQGLSAALQQLADKMDAIYDQKVTLRVSERAEQQMTTHQSGTTFYIIEEAVNNARKHAKASEIRVSVGNYEKLITIEIKDDGVGFDVSSVTEHYEDRTSLGMVNLYERAELIDGTLTIDSAPGNGTTISVVFPIVAQADRRDSTLPRKPNQNKAFRLSAIR